MPVGVVGPGEKFTFEKVPDGENLIRVFVTDVNNPGDFYFQIKGKTQSDALDVLMNKIK